MTTPQEFAIKTDSSWAYPKEMYVYDGTTDKEASEVYTWNGTEAVLVWPVPFYAPGTINGITGDTYPLESPVPTDFIVNVPIYWSDYDQNDRRSPMSLREVGDDVIQVGSEYGAASYNTGSYQWDEANTLGVMKFTSSFGSTAQGTPYYIDAFGGLGVGTSNSDLELQQIVNWQDTGYSGPSQDEWRLRTSEEGASYDPWDYDAQGTKPLVTCTGISLRDFEEENSHWAYTRSDSKAAGGPDYWAAGGIAGAHIYMKTTQPVGSTYPTTATQMDINGDFNVSLKVIEEIYDGQSGNFATFQNGLQNGGYDIEPFPQGVDNAVWDPAVVYTPSVANMALIGGEISAGRSDYGADTTIKHIKWISPSGEAYKVRFDNMFGAVGNRTNSNEFQWCTGNGGNQMVSDRGGYMIRTAPWLRESGTPAFGDEDLTLFSPAYTKPLVYMSNAHRSNASNPSHSPGGYEWVADNLRRYDHCTTRPYSGDTNVQRTQGVMWKPGEIIIEHRKALADSRLLWEEVGCTVTTAYAGILEPRTQWRCTEGTINSFFPSGNDTFRRIISTRLPRYRYDPAIQFKVDDFNCTDGDATNYDGDFQKDFFDRSEYVELRVYNRTTGMQMRSHAWGDASNIMNTDSEMIDSRSVLKFDNGGNPFTRLQPIFMMNPDDSVQTGADNLWYNFFSSGDVIDFKLYAR